MLAFGANDVLLDKPAVVNLPDILDENRRANLPAVDEFDRDVVEIVDRRRQRIGPHRVLEVSHLRRSGRDSERLRIDGVDDIVWGQAFGLQLQRVDIDHDLPIFSAGRGRQRDAVNWRELLAHPVDAVIVELGAVERIRAQGNLKNRHARGVVADNDRRLDAGRHERADGVRGRNDLGDRQIDVDVGLEVKFLNGDAVERLRLDILDAVDVRRDRILAVGCDPLLHLRRRETRILPNDRHDGDVDLGKNVGRHGQNSRYAENQDQRRQHEKRVRKLQRKADNSHFASLAL